MRSEKQLAALKQLRTVTLPIDVLDRLEPFASCRGIHRNQLVRDIIESALDAGLINAILDDDF